MDKDGKDRIRVKDSKEGKKRKEQKN